MLKSSKYVRSVVAEVKESNTRSKRVLEGNGFRFVMANNVLRGEYSEESS